MSTSLVPGLSPSLDKSSVSFNVSPSPVDPGSREEDVVCDSVSRGDYPVSVYSISQCRLCSGKL